MWRNTAVVVFMIVLISCAVMCVADAQGWQWPDKMTIAGFNITDIKGTVRPDGSGSATGTLLLDSIGNQRVTLARTSRGDITGSITLNGKAAGAGVQGSLTLTENCLNGRGIVQSSPRPIADALMNITPGGKISGSGEVSLGGINISTDFNINGSFDVSGAAAVRREVDTPLALYTFDGSLNLKGESGKILVFASGQVQRTGKVANQVSSEKISDVAVNPSDGQATINVGGVNVTFKFF